MDNELVLRDLEGYDNYIQFGYNTKSGFGPIMGFFKKKDSSGEYFVPDTSEVKLYSLRGCKEYCKKWLKGEVE